MRFAGAKSRSCPVSRRALALACAAGFLAAVPASAHLVTTGLGPVYDGISHLLVSFDDLLPVVALALLAGLNGPAAGRRTLVALPGAWLAAGLAGHAAGHTLRLDPLPGLVGALTLLVAGTLVAADRRLPPAAVAALAAAIGGLHGFANGAALALDGREARSLLGIGAAVFVLAAIGAALVIAVVGRTQAPWTRIVVRVAGSWLTAIGLLMAGWELR